MKTFSTLRHGAHFGYIFRHDSVDGRNIAPVETGQFYGCRLPFPPDLILMVIALDCKIPLVQYFGHTALVPGRHLPTMLNPGGWGAAAGPRERRSTYHLSGDAIFRPSTVLVATSFFKFTENINSRCVPLSVFFQQGHGWTK